MIDPTSHLAWSFKILRLCARPSGATWGQLSCIGRNHQEGIKQVRDARDRMLQEGGLVHDGGSYRTTLQGYETAIASWRAVGRPQPADSSANLIALLDGLGLLDYKGQRAALRLVFDALLPLGILPRAEGESPGE